MSVEMLRSRNRVEIFSGEKIKVIIMTEMSFENIFLKQTAFTSTKNKYILLSSEENERSLHPDEANLNQLSNLNSRIGSSLLKRKYDFSFLDDAAEDRNPLTSTKNKFLANSFGDTKKAYISEKHGDFSLKKKKKKLKVKSKRWRRACYNADRDRERYRERGLSSDESRERDTLRHRFHSKKRVMRSYCLAADEIERSNSEDAGIGADAAEICAFQHSGISSSNKKDKLKADYIMLRDMDYPVIERSMSSSLLGNSYEPTIDRLEQKSCTKSCSAPTAQFLPDAPNFAFGSSSFASRGMFRAAPAGVKFSSGVIRPITAPDISEMPVYNFSSDKELVTEAYKSFSFIDHQANLLQLEKIHDIKAKKIKFLNIASMALIYSSNLKDVNDTYRMLIQKYADDVKTFEPEFILKVALFSRQELHIRSASNFLLSYAAYCEETRPYLEKYFESCIRLPSDFIEVAELYLVFNDSRLKTRSLPSSLKKVMMKSFSKFDAYQLAKYNREKKGAKTSGFTLKQLIRLLHLNSPANEIMGLLGKKYPETAEAFRKSRLPGIWDSRRVGERMKLPIPETWETQISSQGNKPEVWEKLIDNGKLPYMAMLRNLKNLILSGISQKHHDKILKQLQNKIAVVNSRQTPLQFYEAFKALIDMEDAFYSRNVYANETFKGKPWQKNRKIKFKESVQKISISLVGNYQKAVSNALEISALHNLQPIPGKTLVICDILLPPSFIESKQKKLYQLSIMMGLMCLKACEDCKMNLICGDFSETIFIKEDIPFFQSMKDVCSEHERLHQNVTSFRSSRALKKIFEFYLKQHVVLREKLDHVVILRTSSQSGDEEVKDAIKSFLHKYRQVVNPELLYTEVDFERSSSSCLDSDSEDGKNVFLGGNPSQLVKFIAERCNGGQLTYVDNIDHKYDLKTNVNSEKFKKLDLLPKQEKLPVLTKVPKWHTVRVFISSTFKDMHCERDSLIRYVMPELKKRAASVFVKVNEVDLRWGITETDCCSKRAAELCLLEAQKSDLFIGILGDRYGTIYNFDPPDSPDLQWVKEYPHGLSITELEMYAGALKEKSIKKKAFFYIRNNSFLSQMPEKWRKDFDSEDPESKQKVESLKAKIRSSGFTVCDGYSCQFAGLFNGKPVLSGLDKFGRTVLHDMWQAIKEMHEEDPYVDDELDEETCQQDILQSYYFVDLKNSPVDSLIKEIKEESGIFLITGTPGCGKTSFVINVLQNLKNFSVIKFFVGLTPRSTELSYMLQYISNSIARMFPVSSVFPRLTSDVINHFPDILQEAVNSSGNANFVLVIDGLDHLSANDQLLDWLPLNLPKNLRLICTASESSYPFKVLSERHTHEVSMHVQNLPVISQSDRECIVRHYLKLYGKSLDESSFNNQMLLMVTKKDSGIPLYLRMLCDYLRTYAGFDNLMSMLQSLPSAMPMLLQEIIIQMENEYGSVLVQTILVLLCITKEGLDDNDLYILLSLVLLDKENRTFLTFNEVIKQTTKLGPDNMMSQTTYCSLVHTICSFAYGHSRFRKFTLVGSEFEKAVEKFYLNKNFMKFSKYMHRILAAYYYTICDIEKTGSWKGCSGSAYRGLIYHLFNGECYLELASYLCSLQFLEAIFRIEAANSLLEYYSLLFEERQNRSNEIIRKIDFPLLTSFYDFISRNLHIFQICPDLVMQQALNEPSESLVKRNLQGNVIYKLPVIECLSQYEGDPRIATLRGFFKNITAVVCQKNTPHALLGSEDGYLKVLDFTSKKIIRSVKSHSSSITFICLAGKNRICTASTDTTLSIWSSVDYSRISVLKGHRHIVSCCCADYSSNILLSSGWDNSVRLWSLKDGRFISTIEFGCPVNCLDHHPLKQQVACGLWNGNVEIWDTVSLQRNVTLSNNSSSVKSVVYTADGINIISSYMNSDVTIWSSDLGLKISNLKGHILPVKSISYSPEQDMIISGSDDCTLKVWPTELGLSLHTLSACKFCPISLLEIISPNYLAVGFQNSDIWIMDITTGFAVTKMALEADIVSCFSRFHSATYARNTEENWVDLSVVFGTQSGKILIGNLQTSAITTVGNIKARVTAIIHNMRIIVCGSSEGDIGLFSYPELDTKVINGAHGGSVTSLDLFVRNENVWVMSSGSDKMIKLWEIDYEELVFKQEFISKHYDYVTCLCWFPVSNIETNSYLTGSHDNNIILQSGTSKTVFQGLKTSIINVDFTNNCILGCASDGSVAVWSQDGKLLSFTSGIEQSSVVLSFRIDKTNTTGDFDVTLAFVDKDGSVKIKKPNQRSFSYSLEGHSRSITSCCTNENGEILSCSLDGTVNLWKIPSDTEDIHMGHSAYITDISMSVSENVVISSDIYGNIILWKLKLSPTNISLDYAGKKTYIGGFIKAISLFKEKHFVCAITQTTNDGEKHFLDMISFDCNISEDNSLYSFQIKASHNFDSEVLCLDTNFKTNKIAVGLKSGDIIIITSDAKKTFNVSKDWVLGMKLFHSENSTEYLFTSLLNGSVERIEISEDLKCDVNGKASSKELPHPNFGNVSPYLSALCCENVDSVYCGDSQGWLRRYSTVPISKKIHDDSITGISVAGLYIFTSSLDKTLKGWDTTLNQVCQFHSSVPITSLVGCKVIITESFSTYILLIGTSSGTVQLLKFHDKRV
ncbi:hypothetical protein CDAR_118681 [Caerostris darwini]|uniref:TROVE domain-containing protein n=1 Tax=Caerostris darwini TaxID=1538125 RepID=A0AAV4WXR5_9ARAC|nr:hypothetical protein CDAR_118681 [Caerostris darwini]